MPYVRDTEVFSESDTEARDDEAAPVFQRQFNPFAPLVAPFRAVGGLTGGTVNTPAGQAQVRFDKPLATKESVDELAKELKRELATQAEAIKKIDQTVDRNTGILDKKVAGVQSNLKKGLENAQQMSILPMLFTKPPQIQSVQWAAQQGAGANAFAAGGTAAVATNGTTYISDSNMGLMLILMMSGGFGGGSSGDSSNMMMLALAMSGAFK